MDGAPPKKAWCLAFSCPCLGNQISPDQGPVEGKNKQIGWDVVWEGFLSAEWKDSSVQTNWMCFVASVLSLSSVFLPGWLSALFHRAQGLPNNPCSLVRNAAKQLLSDPFLSRCAGGGEKSHTSWLHPLTRHISAVLSHQTLHFSLTAPHRQHFQLGWECCYTNYVMILVPAD